MSEIDGDDIMNSFSAIRFFLQNKKLNPVQRNKVICFIKVDNQLPFEDDIEFECLDFKGTYILHSDLFKAYRYYRPVWSEYHLFSWDDNLKELKVELNNHTFIFKHKK